MGCSFVNYFKWMLQVNEANEGFNKIKWSNSSSEWENKWIRLTMKTRKKEKYKNAFANNESWITNDEGNNERWMTNAERWIQCLLHDNYDNNTILWMVGECTDLSKNFIPQWSKILVKKSKISNLKSTIF